MPPFILMLPLMPPPFSRARFSPSFLVCFDYADIMSRRATITPSDDAMPALLPVAAAAPRDALRYCLILLLLLILYAVCLPPLDLP